MRLITEIELNEVSGGLWDMSAGGSYEGDTFDYGGDNYSNVFEVYGANGDNGVEAVINNISTSFTCNDKTGSCTLTVGGDVVTVSPLIDGLATLKVNGDVVQVVPLTIDYPKMGSIPDIIPGAFP